jgi:hypothetical protein
MLSWIKRHWGCISAILILILICAFLFHSWLDAIVSLDYAYRENEFQGEEIAVLQMLLLETGKRMNRSEMTQLVTEHFSKGHLIKEEEHDELSVDSVVLKFSGNSLVKVKSYGE